MESTKVIAQGKWIVEESVENLTSDVQHITIVKDESRGVIGKFINRISAVDARMIANAPDMLGMLKLMESAISSMLYQAPLSTSYIHSLLCEARRIIDNVK